MHRCLHLFVPAKRDAVDGHSKINLNTGYPVCRTDGIDIQDTERCNPTIITDIAGKNEVIKRNVRNDQIYYYLLGICARLVIVFSLSLLLHLSGPSEKNHQ